MYKRGTRSRVCTMQPYFSPFTDDAGVTGVHDPGLAHGVGPRPPRKWATRFANE